MLQGFRTHVHRIYANVFKWRPCMILVRHGGSDECAGAVMQPNPQLSRCQAISYVDPDSSAMVGRCFRKIVRIRVATRGHFTVWQAWRRSTFLRNGSRIRGTSVSHSRHARPKPVPRPPHHLGIAFQPKGSLTSNGWNVLGKPTVCATWWPPQSTGHQARSHKSPTMAAHSQLLRVRARALAASR